MNIIKNNKGELGLLITAIVWGIGFVAVDMSLEFLTPYQTNTLRFFIAFIFLFIVFYKKIKLIDKKTIIHGCILGVLLFFGFTTQTLGLKYTTPSKNAFLTALNVIIVPFISSVVYKNKVDKHSVIGAIIAILGISFLSFDFNLIINIGDVLSIICAVFFAFQILLTGEFVKDSDPIALTMIQLMVTFILSFFIMVFRGEFISLKYVPLHGFLPVIYLALFATVLAYILQTVCQKFTTPTKTAIILCTESVFGSIAAVLFGRDIMTLRLFTGAALIFCAIIISETKIVFLKTN